MSKKNSIHEKGKIEFQNFEKIEGDKETKQTQSQSRSIHKRIKKREKKIKLKINHVGDTSDVKFIERVVIILK